MCRVWGGRHCEFFLAGVFVFYGVGGSSLTAITPDEYCGGFADRWFCWIKDVSDGMFGIVAPGGDGRVKGVEWWW